MAKRDYGQYCGVARALEMIGERWALLIVRDLIVGPRRFTDLRHGLPRIPTNILTARLNELEHAGVVHRRAQPRPDSFVVYELTGYGRQLEGIVLALCRWGAQSLGEPGPNDVLTADALTIALRTTFRPDSARRPRTVFELRTGDAVLTVIVDRGRLGIEPGPAARPDLTIETGPRLRAIMAGELTPAQAVESGAVRLTGDPALLATFADTFRLDR